MSTEPTRDVLLLRLLALYLGASDMWDVWQTARYLIGDHEEALAHVEGLPEKVRRTLETGMIVSYARPFVESRRGLRHLKRARDLGSELRALHEEILVRRHSVYAHSDETVHRRIIEFADPSALATWLQDPDATFSEEWHSLTESGLRDLMALSKAHLDAFIDEIDQVRQRILSEVEHLVTDAGGPTALAEPQAGAVRVRGPEGEGDLLERPRVIGEFVEPDEVAIPLLVAIGRFVFAAGGLEQALRLETVRLAYTELATASDEPEAALSAEIAKLRRLPAGGLLARLRELGLATELHDRVRDAIRWRNDLVHRTFEDPDLMLAAIDGSAVDDVVERVNQLAIGCGELTVEFVAFAVAKMEELFGMSRDQLFTLVLSADPESVTDPADAQLVEMIQSLDDPDGLLSALNDLHPIVNVHSDVDEDRDENDGSPKLS